ncbi:MAG: hypothetical protein LWX07_05050 [Bacteroidetes bacterium]|nr:hypothetical protein [Bacteroidota bacterium]
MKKNLIYLAVLLIFLAGAAYAQDDSDSGRNGKKRSPGEMMKKEMQLLKDSLNLTDSQKPFVQKVLEDSFKKMADVRKNNGGMEEMKSVMDERDTNLKTVLTEEQWAKYNELQKSRRDKFRDDDSGNHKHRRNGNPNN